MSEISASEAKQSTTVSLKTWEKQQDELKFTNQLQEYEGIFTNFEKKPG